MYRYASDEEDEEDEAAGGRIACSENPLAEPNGPSWSPVVVDWAPKEPLQRMSSSGSVHSTHSSHSSASSSAHSPVLMTSWRLPLPQGVLLNTGNTSCVPSSQGILVCVWEAEGQYTLHNVSLGTAASLPLSSDSRACPSIDSSMLAFTCNGFFVVQNVNNTKMWSSKVTEPRFWKFVSTQSLLLVDGIDVFLWTLPAGSEDPSEASLTQIFGLDERLRGHSIVEASCSPDGNLVFIVGVKMHEGNLRGLVQLYDLDCGKGSCTHAQAACFVQTRLALYRKYSPLLMCVSSVQDGVCTVKMRDVNRESQGQYVPKEATFPYDEGDFPVGMVHHSGFGFLQILSRKGSFHVVEVESGGVIYSTHLSSNLLFFQCCQLLDQGAVCFSRDGDIFYLPTNYPANVMQYLMEYCDNSVVFCVAARCDLPGAEPLFHTALSRRLEEGRFEIASRIIFSSPQGCLRNRDVLESLRDMPEIPGEKQAFVTYMSLLLSEDFILNGVEFELLCSIANTPEKEKYICTLISKGYAHLTEERKARLQEIGCRTQLIDLLELAQQRAQQVEADRRRKLEELHKFHNVVSEHHATKARDEETERRLESSVASSSSDPAPASSSMSEKGAQQRMSIPFMMAPPLQLPHVRNGTTSSGVASTEIPSLGVGEVASSDEESSSSDESESTPRESCIAHMIDLLGVSRQQAKQLLEWANSDGSDVVVDLYVRARAKFEASLLGHSVEGILTPELQGQLFSFMDQSFRSFAAGDGAISSSAATPKPAPPPLPPRNTSLRQEAPAAAPSTGSSENASRSDAGSPGLWSEPVSLYQPLEEPSVSSVPSPPPDSLPRRGGKGIRDRAYLSGGHLESNPEEALEDVPAVPPVDPMVFDRVPSPVAAEAPDLDKSLDFDFSWNGFEDEASPVLPATKPEAPAAEFASQSSEPAAASTVHVPAHAGGDTVLVKHGDEEVEVVSDFICPISHEIMREPVVARDGFSYEASCLRDWFSTGRISSPITGQELPDTLVIPNFNLRNAIFTLYGSKFPSLLPPHSSH